MPRQRTAIVVLGMHRSGTSSLAGALHLLGAAAPRTLLPANDANPRGFWESRKIYSIHEEMLLEIVSSWDDWRPVAPEWFDSDTAAAFATRLADAITDEFGDAPLFVLKDPRICRFLPLWTRVLAELGVKPVAVHIIRNPLEVARSLERRDGLSPHESLLLWLRHVLDAELHSRQLSRCFVRYEQLLEDWEGVVRDVGRRTGIVLPGLADVTSLQIDEFLSSELRHTHVTSTQLRANTDVVSWVKQAYASVSDLVATSAAPAALRTLDKVKAAFEVGCLGFGAIVTAAERQADLLTRDLQGARLHEAELAARLLETEVSRDVLIGSLSVQVAAAAASRNLSDRRESDLHRAIDDREERHIKMDAKYAALLARSQELELVLAEVGPRTSAKRQHDESTADGQHVREALETEGILCAQVREAVAVEFDAAFYRSGSLNVAQPTLDPVEHFIVHGWKLGHDPHPRFSVTRYLEDHPDVRAASINPYVHYLVYGRHEGRAAHASARLACPSPSGELFNSASPHTSVADARGAATEVYRTMLAAAVGDQRNEYVPLAPQGSALGEAAVKVLAFYLPQFHPIPENDRWWGTGFTEWTNVSKAVPQFVGHYQPHLPGELGFYDLRVPTVQRRQVELARNYGVSGFCFYYYWFGGTRLLEGPLNQFASDQEIDFPFCICWANENWTRRWDGQEHDILIDQDHTEANDFRFIDDIADLMRHRNYIRIHGRPLLIVYRVKLIPNAAATAERWRERCNELGLGDPYLVVAQVFENVDPREVGFDAAVEFPPNTPGLRRTITEDVAVTNPAYSGVVHHYDDLVELTARATRPPYHLFRTVCPGWDNEARRPGRGSTYAFSSPASYGRWLADACRFALADPDPEKRLVFVNAWNEWAEGAHLEPDRRYGYAYLQATADVVASLPAPKRELPNAWTMLVVSHDACRGGAQLVLLNALAWLQAHTSVRLKILCLQGGEWLGRFQEIADTTLWSDLDGTEGDHPDVACVAAQLLEFCGGQPALIYGNSVAAGRAYAVLAELHVPILTHVHELESSIARYASDWMPDLLARSSHYVACCEPVRRNLVANHRVAAADISVVHESIRTDSNVEPVSVQARTKLRTDLGLEIDGHLIVGCGIGMPFRKGADLFIEVARQVQRLCGNDIRFCWVGDFNELESDPEFGVWSDHLAALRESGPHNVRFLGVKDDPRQYLLAADVFLLPSREDPFPLVALEAAECGVPIVCFDEAGGMPTFVGHDAGFVVPFGDVDAMAHSVSTLVRESHRRRELGTRARQKLLSGFTVDRTTPHLLSCLRSVAGRKPTVSVIVPNYNHGKYLTKRLDSIFGQTYRDFEVIILDDASSDDSLEVIERYRDRGDVRIVTSPLNSGSTFKQWLRGIDLARADILWIAESDDSCDEEFLAGLLPAFRNPAVKVAYANSLMVDEHDTKLGDYSQVDYLTNLSESKWRASYEVSAEREINDGLGVKNTILSASAVLFRRFELEPATRETMAQMRIAGDWYFHIHAIQGGSIYYTPRPLSTHRRHSESVIGKLLKERHVEEFFKEFWQVQRVIFSKYRLRDECIIQWERYLREQWAAFFPERPFDEINVWYPLEAARGQLAPPQPARFGFAQDHSPVLGEPAPHGSNQSEERAP